ncbi:MBOAT family O-acyltransferase [Geomonas propionica]|uniref:MBOAT family protein n=1 Tax=Geomonas propionica TaxID=2798582 RepID=A0ABS0YUQ2_9BACT|nr:MBOAT family O-acyltransferase [Geomonas propionica]MBJ6801700.1 MBOAT family protein [Geomonas propionica]
MPFNSLHYFIFLPIVYLVFYLAGDRARWGVLLAASFGFYCALKVPYLPVVLTLVTLTTYCFGIWLHKAQGTRAKLAVLWGGIASNVLVLVLMKYLPFFSENLGGLCRLLSLQVEVPTVRAFVAIGVSYFVFQAISYLIDIYFEVEEPEPHLGYFALYLSFFPKLLQGPIERAGDLLPQLKTPYRFDYDNMRYGMLLFAWGLFKKVVLADRLGIYADAVYNDVHAATGLQLLLGTYAYAFQIFMDFSGYTDMALGTARLFNINLTQNFNSPYLATSVADFWRRWHISFSRWILDYIFKPLQMQWRDWRTWGTAAALVVAFLVSGIWHGASWGFVIWGGLHGLYMACSVFYKPYQKKIYQSLGIQKSRYLKYWQMLVTFHLVCFAWVFFRVNSLGDALYICRFPFERAGRGLHNVLVHGFDTEDARLVLIAGALVALCGTLARNERVLSAWNRHGALRWLSYNALLLALIFLGTKSQASFIYFNF